MTDKSPAIDRRTVLTTAGGLLAAGLGAGTVSGGSDDFNCDDFSSHAEAQAVYEASEDDQHGLDHDNDGVACEDLQGSSQPEPEPEPEPEAESEVEWDVESRRIDDCDCGWNEAKDGYESNALADWRATNIYYDRAVFEGVPIDQVRIDEEDGREFVRVGIDAETTPDEVVWGALDGHAQLYSVMAEAGEGRDGLRCLLRHDLEVYAEFWIDVDWARSCAYGEISTDRYYERILETMEEPAEVDGW